MKKQENTFTMRAYLELKDGSFLGTMELLRQPER